MLYTGRFLLEQVRKEILNQKAPIFIAGSQDLNEGNSDRNSQLAIQRQVELSLFDNDITRYAFSTYDLPTYDGIHQTELSQNISGTRFAYQAIALITNGKESRGPKIVSAKSISSTQTDINILHRAGSDFSPGSGIAGFFLGTLEKPIKLYESVRLSENIVRLSHEYVQSPSRTVSYALFTDTDDQRCVHDNSLLTLPLEPSEGFIAYIE